MFEVRSRRNESGYSLAEILVAVAIFAIIFIAALMIYDRSNRVFKSGVESSNTQQATRVAFDRVVADLRMAGFDYDRDGIPSASFAGVNQSQQPDEQIEYVGQGAVTLRGNLDYETDPSPAVPVGVPNCNHGCEPDYVPPQFQFPLITTGNDEIVTYALLSPTAPAGNPIKFFVDSFKPRKVYTVTGGTPEKEQEIVIESTVNAAGQTLYVDQTNLYPPYTLYRITLKEDAATQGNPNKVLFTPVAENIRGMRFQFYEDAAGTLPLRDLASPPAVIPQANLATTVGGLGQYDPANPAASVTPRAIRSRVQSVRLTLVGMNEAADFNYTDPNEPIAAMRPFRKYRLETLITPRNYARRGMREQEFKEPGAPTLVKVCYGYCSMFHLEWTAPAQDATKGMVEDYAIVFDIDNDTTFPYLVPVGNVTSAFVTVPDPEKTWFFAIKAINSYGSATSNVMPVAPTGYPAQNATKPVLDTTQLHASGDGHPEHPPQANQVMLQWQMPTSGSGVLTCTTGSPSPVYPIQETKGFRIYRRVNTPAPNEQNNMPPGNGWTQILDENASGANAPQFNPLTNTVTWYDKSAANCVEYWYRIQGAERCPNPAGNVSGIAADNLTDMSPPFIGQALSAGMPKAPAGLDIDYTGIPPNSNCDETLNTCTATLIWPRVQVDVSDQPMTIEYYRIFRTRKKISTGAANVDEFDVDSTMYTESGGQITFTLNDGALDKNGNAQAFPEHDNADNNDYAYEFRVAAKSCDNIGGQSSIAPFPCPFGGATPITITTTMNNALQGDGTAASPWMVTTPADFTVTTSSNVSFMRATVFPPVGAPVVICQQSGTFSSMNCSWPTALSDEVVYRLDVFLQDLTSPIACPTTRSYFVSESNNNCCLTPESFDSTIVQLDGPSGRVRVRLDNNCGDNLQIQNEGVQITWNAALVSGGGGSSNKRLRRVVYPKPTGGGITMDDGSNDGVDQNCSVSVCNATSDPEDADTDGPGKNPVPANSNSYILEFRFGSSSGPGSFTTSPLTKLCIGYKRPTADLSTQICKIVPVPSNTANVCD